ncbi:hypothetical protein GY21_15840 [Cryobacterium roopkundense]|uniref:Sortase n=1 Tax=Cryobacterium roopkundense TaxID=1001240 RepID=A0A099J251_9MICO|nr:hypothetical protein [Cryobacterium roopkundense]KGJ72366.1 hypothetical protein GY21_15840 [Cryobacterium roopkundense]MBB5642373.1 hypothetical protein [Cryobacterium roopkundense]
MVKKVLAAVVLAILAIFSVPAAALAAGYVPDSAITVSGSAVPGGTVTVSIPANSFLPNEPVAFAISGSGSPTIAVVKAATASVTKNATPVGAASVTVGLPSNATGTYNGTATGLTSGNVVTWTIVVSSASGGAASESGGLPATGYQLPSVLLWSAVGALMIGIALLVVLVMARRRGTHADT